jgi:preprotein translocase subunit SecA
MINSNSEVLNEINFSFDKEKAVRGLKLLPKTELIKEKAAELNYLIRKFELNYNDFDIKLDDAFEFLKCNQYQKNDVYLMIGYMIQKSNIEINDEIISKVKNLLTTCSEDSTKLFLESQIEKNRDRKLKTSLIEKIPTKKKNCIFVEKQNQRIEITHKHQQETEIKLLDINEVLKNRQKNQENDIDRQLKKQPTEKGVGDISYFEIWKNYLNLYIFTIRGKMIKKELTEDFLLKNFLIYHYYNINNIIDKKSFQMWSFFINRMIAAMLSKLSLNQSFNDYSINKLMMCLVGYDEMIKKLNFKNNDFVKIFTDAVFENYKIIQNMREPDFFITFAKKIINETIIIENKKPKKREFERKEIEEIIKEEIKKLRFDAVTALYNACTYNNNHLTKDRIDIIAKFLNDQSDDDESLKKVMRKLYDIITYSNEINYEEIFKSYLSDFKKQDFSNYDNKIRFIESQSIQSERRKALFNSDVFSTLIETFKFKESDEIVEIINNYVLDESTVSLSENLLERITDLCINNDKGEMFFLTILYSVKKSESLQNKLMNKLISNFTVKNANFIVLILSEIKNHESYIKSEKELEILSHTLQNSYYVVYSEKIEFLELLYSDNSDETVISLLSSKIIFDSINQKSIISEKTIENLIESIESNKDKQTQIYSAKCIYKISKYNPKSLKNHANEILGFIENNIDDISVYMQTVYCKILASLIEENQMAINDEILKNLSSYFLKYELNYGAEKLHEEINKCVFIAFQNLAERHIFLDENFNLFEWILVYSNEEDMKAVIKILQIYTKRYKIPKRTIEALENSFGYNELRDIALLTFENVINNSQYVSEDTLKIFFDDFYISTDPSRRLKSFKLMEKARMNQVLNESLFFTLELNKAAYSLSGIEDKIYVLDFIKNLTDKKPLYLPIDLIKGLTELFSDSNNEHEFELIEIFENMTNNHQAVPEKVLNIMQSRIEKGELQEKILSIFAELKLENLPEVVFKKIISKLEKDIHKKKYFSVVLPFVEKNKESIKNNSEYKKSISKIIQEGLSTKDNYIQEICIRLIIFEVFDNESLKSDVINEKFEEIIIKKNFTPEIKTLIDRSSYLKKPRYHATRKLTELEYISNKEYLEKVKELFLDGGNLCSENLEKLKEIIDEESDVNLTIDALDIVHESIHSKHLPKSIDYTIVKLMGNSNNNYQIWKRCKDFLEAFKAIGKTYSLDTETKYKNIIKKRKFDECLLSEFNLEDSIKTNIITFFKKIKNLNQSENLEDYLQNIVNENILSYKENIEFSYFIKSYLNKYPKNKNALLFYARILKEQNDEYPLNEPLETLVNELKDSCYLDLLVECIYNTSENQHMIVPDNCLQLLEMLVENENSIIRFLAFKGLKNRSKKFKLNAFVNSKLQTVLNFGPIKFDEMLLTLNKKEKRYNLLEVILSLNYIDFDVFCSNEEKYWRRELILSNLFQEFQVLKGEKRDFYKNWFKIEDSKTEEESVKILSLILHRRSFFTDFKEIIETVIFMDSLNFDSIMSQLYNFLNPYKKFKTEWCMRKIKGKLRKENSGNEILCLNLIKLDISFITKLFQSISTIDNLSIFEELISFCCKKNFHSTDLIFGIKSIPELKNFLHIKYICKNINNFADYPLDDQAALYEILNSLEKNWNLENLENIVKAIIGINSKNQFKNCFDLLRIVEQFNLSENNYDAFHDILKEKEFNFALKKFHSLAVQQYFHSKTQKSSEELLRQYGELNAICESSITECLKNELDEVKNYIKKYLNWTRADISNWSKNNKKKFMISEAIALINRAIVINKNETSESGKINFDRITDAQIISCLVALKAYSINKGTLLQLATGEGKSIIICILAIINALKHEYVNVITSSSVLAERDAKNNEKLYKIFGLTCSSNNEKSVYIKGPRPCYKSNIVYGDISQFQFDTLRDDYSDLDTLGDRKCEIAIIDEVDVMLIDDTSKIAKLASTIAGLNHFHAVYTLLWCNLMAVKGKLLQIDENIYFLNGNIDKEDGKFVLKCEEENGEILQINDLEEYLKENEENINNVGKKINGKIENFLDEHLKEYLNKLEKEHLKFPKNFQEYFNRQKPIWIKNAIEAMYYQEDIDYIIQDDQINPVDYSSTGVVLKSTHWSDGLHQFLQLKHNLRMTDESLTTNFLSNVTYIRGFKKIYGLSGTLGSPTARKILERTYNVNVSVIPQTYKNQFKEQPIILKRNKSEWLKEICSSSLLEIEKERGVLILCETIESANSIAKSLKNNGASIIKLYTRNDMNQERNVEKINKGEIIVATMIAGRGTDINAELIKDFGGLHIILTFLPNNQRVENQAFGRTGRQGNPGTGQMILNLIHIHHDEINSKQIKNKRDKTEADILEKFEKDELKLILKKDELFKKFCVFLKEFRKMLIDNDEINITLTQNIKNIKEFKKFNRTPTVTEENILASVEEQWAYFLLRFDDKLITIENADNEFKNFEKNISKNWKILTNPYHNIKIGNSGIISNNKKIDAVKYFKDALNLKIPSKIIDNIKWVEKTTRAVKNFVNNSDKIVENDDLNKEGKLKLSCIKNNIESIISSKEDLLGASYFGMAYLILKKPASSIEKIKSKKHLSIKLFEKSLETVTGEIALINTMQTFKSLNSIKFVKSSLEKQLLNKSNLLNIFQSNIQECVDVIRKSLRFIDLVIEKNKERICYFNLERNNEGHVDFVDWDSNAIYKITFNDLTSQEDAGKKKDQAFETIDKLDIKKGSTIQLKFCKVDLSRLKLLLNKNKEFEGLTKSEALSTLKAESSFLEKIHLSSSYLVDLKTVRNNETLSKFNDQQISEVMKILKNDTNDDSKFTLNIKDANKNVINENLSEENIQIVLENLDIINAKEKISKIKANSLCIEINAKPKQLKSIVSSEIIKSKQFKILNKLIKKGNFTESFKYEIFGQTDAVKKIENNKENFMMVEILEVNTDEAENLLKSSNENENISFTITFTGFKFFKSSKDLNGGQVDFYVDNLNKEQSKKFIGMLRKENLDFSLEFINLDCKNVQNIIYNASLNQEDIEIDKIKDFMQVCNDEVSRHDLYDLTCKGIEFLIYIREKGSIPWRTIIILGSFALIQLSVGIILCAFGLSANFGIGFIADGIHDLYRLYKVCKTRKFNWKAYAIEKSVSLIFSVISGGLLQKSERIIGEIGTEVGEQLATSGVTNAKKFCTKVVSKIIKSKPAKAIIVSLQRSIIQGMIGISLNDQNQKFNPVLYESQINEKVESIIRTKFLNNSEVMGILKKFYALDSLNKNNNYKNEINTIVRNITEKIQKLLDKSFEIKLENLISGFQNSSEITFICALKELPEIDSSIDNVLKEFHNKLMQNDKKHKMTNILQETLNIEKQVARNYSKILHENEVTDKNEVMCYSNLEGLEKKIDNLKQKHQKIGEFLSLFFKEYNDIQINEFKKIFSDISLAITEQLINIMILNIKHIETLKTKFPDPNMLLENEQLNKFFENETQQAEIFDDIGSSSIIETLVERDRNLQYLNSIIFKNQN